MMREGTCWLYSASDPRWNARATGSVGMFMQIEQSPLAPQYAAFKAQYGEPPDDLEFGYMKD